MTNDYTSNGKKVDSITLDDIMKAWESIPKSPDKSEMIEAIYCHEDSKDKMLEKLEITERTNEYPNYLFGYDVVTRKSIPENKVYILMQDGKIKILDLDQE